jgi:hypothetical protein
MISLAEKIRQSRHCTAEINGLKFYYTRPTDIQMAALFAASDGKHNKYDVAKQFVFGWNLKESDLIPDGEDKPVKFDDELFAEWLADARDSWGPLYESIMGSYVEYSTDREDALKN